MKVYIDGNQSLLPVTQEELFRLKQTYYDIAVRFQRKTGYDHVVYYTRSDKEARFYSTLGMDEVSYLEYADRLKQSSDGCQVYAIHKPEGGKR